MIFLVPFFFPPQQHVLEKACCTHRSAYAIEALHSKIYSCCSLLRRKTTMFLAGILCCFRRHSRTNVCSSRVSSPEFKISVLCAVLFTGLTATDMFRSAEYYGHARFTSLSFFARRWETFVYIRWACMFRPRSAISLSRCSKSQSSTCSWTR